ncbi:neurotrimin-like [Dysidea avara]|uniref:neurotrimin-like n=1 Tax=Dysidea avara TaxID=196820 RepID=UPI003334450F
MLVVHEFAPYNVVIISDNTYDNGDQLELNCSSEGGPDLVYSWSRVNDFSSDTVTNTSTLNVSNLVTVDGGDYTCTVTNDAGTSSTTVTVYVAPYNVVIMGNNTYDNGDQLELNCLSEGGPDLEYSWSRTNTFSNDTVTNLNTLIISDLATVDGGEYTCFVTNDAGTSMNTITVNVWQGLQNGSIKTYNCPFDCLSAFQ